MHTLSVELPETETLNYKTVSNIYCNPNCPDLKLFGLTYSVLLWTLKVQLKPMQKCLNKLSRDKDDDGKLNEEIDRIKKLLK